MNIPRFLELLQGRPAGGRFRSGDSGQSAAGLHRPRVPASLRQPLPPAGHRHRREHARSAPLHRRFGSALRPISNRRGPLCLPQAGPHRQASSPWPARARRALPRAFYLALLGHEVTVFETQARGRRHAALCAPEYRLPKPVLAPRGGAHRAGWASKFLLRRRGGFRHLSERPGRAVRRGVPVHRNLEGILGLPGRYRAERRHARAAVPGGNRSKARPLPRDAAWWSSAAATRPWIRRAARSAWAPRSTILYRRREKRHAGDQGRGDAAEAGRRPAAVSSPRRTASWATRTAT